jgi:ABC-type polysaccharide/polyol phosphate export permease
MLVAGLKKTFSDISRSLELREVWLFLALDDIIARYKRTLLGPLWNAAYVAATAIALSIVLGGVFGGSLKETLPYVLGGIVAWTVGAGTILEGSNLLIASAGIIQTQNFPYFFYIFRAVARAFLMFLHNFVVYLLVMLVLGVLPLVNWTLPFAVILVAIVTVPYMMMLAMISARFRDVQLFIANFSQVLFFMTPVFWKIDNMHGARKMIVDYNPLAYMVNLVRKPMLGAYPSFSDWFVTGNVLIVGCVLCLITFSIYRRKIPHWV